MSPQQFNLEPSHDDCLAQKCSRDPGDSSGESASTETDATLALRYCVSSDIVYKWKGRVSILDATQILQRLQTMLTPAQTQIVVELRKRGVI